MPVAGRLFGRGRQEQAKGPAEVGYWVATESEVPLEVELPGRTSAYQIAQVRPQVSGVIEARLFEEGAMVKAGQPLYRIDASLYRAAANQAAANLTSAQASAEAAKIKADRYKPLAASQAVAQQDYTDAAATARTAAASVLQTEGRAGYRAHQPALCHRARAHFRADQPFGHDGGALATANQTDALATISVLDPIYVDIQQNAADIMKLRQALASEGPPRNPGSRSSWTMGRIIPCPARWNFPK
jgi:membrane fusion protein (multidrug efflux system)